MLNNNGIYFDSQQHRYYYLDKELCGITGIISKRLFPNKYAWVSEDVLIAAANRGSIIHEQCELMDCFPYESQFQEVNNYKKLIDDNNLNVECSEYIVTDHERIASAIDKVFKISDNEYWLGDIKTTSRLDKKSVSWQLSIYAWLFELNNPDCKVTKLYGIWLRGDKAKLVEVERIPTDIVRDLIEFHFKHIDDDEIYIRQDNGGV